MNTVGYAHFIEQEAKLQKKKPLWKCVNGALGSLKMNNRAELKKSLST